jgi:hypothetical protein
MMKNLNKELGSVRKSLRFKDFLYERECNLFAILESDNSNKSIEAKLKIQKAIIWISVNRGFFAQLLYDLNIYGVSDPSFWGGNETMCTNGSAIIYHPDFVLNQSDAAVRMVLMHEILHCVGDHMVRRGSRDGEIWNWATDFAINGILDQEKKESGDGLDWPKNTDGSMMGLLDEQYLGMSAEAIYDLLVGEEEDPPRPPGPPGDDPPGDDPPGEDDPPRDGPPGRRGRRIEEKKREYRKKQFGDVKDSDEDLPEPTSKDDIAQDRSPEEEKQQDLIGKRIRIIEGPDKGKISTVKDVLPNGDIIIE